ncbi:MAG TPA: hypothetical protein VNM39_19960 [Verrucomicrobiae bacterium]|jgi:hypothetical protein|nr:hypothetical protein [Gemmatimonadales bacterium]HXJ71185.1 hypothetical protein [Verrucomicrobiae bacterium]
MAGRDKALLWLGVMTMIATGVIHLVDAPDSYTEATYKGVLFHANALGCLVVVIGLFRNYRWSWNLGLVIALGSIVAYVASRSVGLPGIAAEPDAWLEPLGVAAVTAEALFTAAYVLRKRP